MRRPTVFMYSGQGSQYYRMGRQLYERHARFRLWMDHCAEIADEHLERPLLDVLYRGGERGDVFDDIRYTSPALVSLHYSVSRVLMEQGLQPERLLGYSLGEYSAAVVAGAMALEDALKLLIDFGEALMRHVAGSGMLAVIAPLDVLDAHHELFAGCTLAGTNFAGHFVVSARSNTLEALSAALGELGIVTHRLLVGYGFHSDLIEPAREAFRAGASALRLGTPRRTIVSSMRGAPLSAVTPEYLWDVIRLPVRFDRTVRGMLGRGPLTFVDVGPSGTLRTFVKRLHDPVRGSRAFEAMNSFGQDSRCLDRLMRETTVEAGAVEPSVANAVRAHAELEWA